MKKVLLLVLMTGSLMAGQMWKCVSFSQAAWGAATSPNLYKAQSDAMNSCAANTPPNLTCYQDLSTCEFVIVDADGLPVNGWGVE